MPATKAGSLGPLQSISLLCLLPPLFLSRRLPAVTLRRTGSGEAQNKARLLHSFQEATDGRTPRSCPCAGNSPMPPSPRLQIDPGPGRDQR